MALGVGHINRYGWWRFYKGSEVCWLWPWRRLEKGEKWLNTLPLAFHTLREMDAFWDGFWEANRAEHQVGDNPIIRGDR